MPRASTDSRHCTISSQPPCLLLCNNLYPYCLLFLPSDILPVQARLTRRMFLLHKGGSNSKCRIKDRNFIDIYPIQNGNGPFPSIPLNHPIFRLNFLKGSPGPAFCNVILYEPQAIFYSKRDGTSGKTLNF